MNNNKNILFAINLLIIFLLAFACGKKEKIIYVNYSQPPFNLRVSLSDEAMGENQIEFIKEHSEDLKIKIMLEHYYGSNRDCNYSEFYADTNTLSSATCKLIATDEGHICNHYSSDWLFPSIQEGVDYALCLAIVYVDNHGVQRVEAYGQPTRIRWQGDKYIFQQQGRYGTSSDFISKDQEKFISYVSDEYKKNRYSGFLDYTDGDLLIVPIEDYQPLRF